MPFVTWPQKPHVVIFALCYQSLKAALIQCLQRLCAVLSCSVGCNSLQPHGLQPARFLCPWGFSRQESWSGLPSPPPGDLPNPGIKLGSPVLQVNSLLSEPTRQGVNSGKQGVTENHFRNWIPIPSIEIELIPLCWFAFYDLATWTLILVVFYFFSF